MIDANGLYVTEHSTRSSALNTINVLVAVTKLLPASAKRVGILFTSDGTNLVQIATTLDGTASPRIFLTGNGGPIYLDREVHGDIVQKPWVAAATAAPVNVGVLEVMEG